MARCGIYEFNGAGGAYWERLKRKEKREKRFSMVVQNELSKRLFDFAVRVIRLLRELPDTAEYRVIKHQLIKSSSSSGANYEESQAGTSRADFNNKVRIALKEKRESNYWLRLIKSTLEIKSFDYNELDFLIEESNELSKILGSIVNKTSKEKR